jgi:Histone methylation protein DOT1
MDDVPLAVSPAELERRRTVDDLMNDEVEPWVSKPAYDLYNDSESIFINDQLKLLNPVPTSAKKMSEEERSREEVHERNRTPSTYGEVTSAGARQLFNHMGMTHNLPSDHDDTTSQDDIVFVDLGSGRGKLVIQAFIELPRITKATGIELAPSRHQSAVTAWEELQSTARTLRGNPMAGDASIPEAEIEFLLLDLLQSDLSEVTHIYIASLCFPDALMHHIAVKLENHAPKLQCVATLREFPMEFEKQGIRDRTNYEFVDKVFGMIRRSEFVEMTWTKRRGGGCEVHFYTKVPFV